jgi:hypothetical protein
MTHLAEPASHKKHSASRQDGQPQTRHAQAAGKRPRQGEPDTCGTYRTSGLLMPMPNATVAQITWDPSRQAATGEAASPHKQQLWGGVARAHTPGTWPSRRAHVLGRAHTHRRRAPGSGSGSSSRGALASAPQTPCPHGSTWTCQHPTAEQKHTNVQTDSRPTTQRVAAVRVHGMHTHTGANTTAQVPTTPHTRTAPPSQHLVQLPRNGFTVLPGQAVHDAGLASVLPHKLRNGVHRTFLLHYRIPDRAQRGQGWGGGGAYRHHRAPHWEERSHTHRRISAGNRTSTFLPAPGRGSLTTG